MVKLISSNMYLFYLLVFLLVFPAKIHMKRISSTTSTHQLESLTIPKQDVLVLMFVTDAKMKTKQSLNYLRAPQGSPWHSPSMDLPPMLTISLIILSMMPLTMSLSASSNKSFRVIKFCTSVYPASLGVVHDAMMVKALLLFETMENTSGVGFRVWVQKTRKELG
jgi:hypothetical protein